MNKKDEFWFKKWLSQLKDTNLKNYKNKVSLVLQKYSIKEIYKNIDLVDNIEELNTPFKKEMALTSLSNFFRFLNKDHPRLREKLVKSINERKEYEDKKITKIFSYKEVYEKWVNIKADEKESLTAKLLIDLYLNYPPLRSDILLVKVKNYNQDDFYIEDNKIIIKKSLKTGLNIPDIQLNKKTIELIKKSQKITDSDYLIDTNNDLEAIDRINNGKSSKLLAKATEKYLGEKININDFRKLAVNRVEEETKFMSPKKRLEKFTNLSKSMAHSLNTQQEKYNIKEYTFIEKDIDIKGKYKVYETDEFIMIKKN